MLKPLSVGQIVTKVLQKSHKSHIRKAPMQQVFHSRLKAGGGPAEVGGGLARMCPAPGDFAQMQ